MLRTPHPFHVLDSAWCPVTEVRCRIPRPLTGRGPRDSAATVPFVPGTYLYICACNLRYRALVPRFIRIEDTNEVEVAGSDPLRAEVSRRPTNRATEYPSLQRSRATN